MQKLAIIALSIIIMTSSGPAVAGTRDTVSTVALQPAVQPTPAAKSATLEVLPATPAVADRSASGTLPKQLPKGTGQPPPRPMSPF